MSTILQEAVIDDNVSVLAESGTQHGEGQGSTREGNPVLVVVLFVVGEIGH